MLVFLKLSSIYLFSLSFFFTADDIEVPQALLHLWDAGVFLLIDTALRLWFVRYFFETLLHHILIIIVSNVFELLLGGDMKNSNNS